MDWFLYDNGLRHEKVKRLIIIICKKIRIMNWPIDLTFTDLILNIVVPEIAIFRSVQQLFS